VRARSSMNPGWWWRRARSCARRRSGRCRARARAARSRARRGVGAHHAGEAAEVLRGDGVALVGHRARPLLPAVKASSASCTSVRCQCRTCTAKRSMPAATSASARRRPRADRAARPAWHRLGAQAQRRRGRRPRWRARGARRCRRRRRWCPRRSRRARRRADARGRGNLGEVAREARPKVMGSAWMPCERPIIGVCGAPRRGRERGESASVRRRAQVGGARSRSAREVSSTSLEVMPRWSQRAGGPASSSTWVRNAITSCLVVPRSRRCGSRRGGSITGRTASAVPGGHEAPRAPSPRRPRARPRASAVLRLGRPELLVVLGRVAGDHGGPG
jgi:hypothetical protein